MVFNIHCLSSSLIFIFTIIYSRVPESEAIVKGENAQIGEFPFMVSLRNSTGGHYCGGTLVTPKHIVTAAHCLYDDLAAFLNSGTDMLDPKNMKVLVGTLSLKSEEGGDLYEVEKLVQHPEYKIDATEGLTSTYDIAVVVLKREVNTKNVAPIPISHANPQDDAPGNAAGWGTLSYNTSENPVNQFDYATRLQKLSVKIQDKITCAEKYRTIGDLPIIPEINTEYIICAKPVVDDAGMCVRDSGSPLIVNGEFVGPVVSGNPCGKGFADIFVSTVAHQDFINSVINA